MTHESETNPLPKPTHTPEQKVEIPEGIRVPSLLQGAIQHQQEYPEEEPTDTYEEAERKLLEKQRSKEPEEHIQTSPTQQEPLDITNSGDGGENQLTGSDIDLIEPTENKPF
ncbi:hypothetical protein CMI48_00485 [Candidatus Pacearchaeota archaeon]|nr:hypothetical protein [Candidatus Pacearchaeota archaeon]